MCVCVCVCVCRGVLNGYRVFSGIAHVPPGYPNRDKRELRLSEFLLVTQVLGVGFVVH